MRYVIVPACLALLATARPAAAQWHPEARHAYEEHWRAHPDEEHWRAHPEHHEEMVRGWHNHLFHREIPAPLLARWTGELRRGIAAPIALAHVLASPEYYVTAGSSPEGFVRTTFVNIVGREPTPPEFRFWLNRLYVTDRAEVAQEMVTRYPPAWINPVPAPVVQYEYRRPVYHWH